MERKRISSSKIRAVGYDRKSQVLEVKFNDGKVLAYSGVSPEVHRQFMGCPLTCFDNKKGTPLAHLTFP